MISKNRFVALSEDGFKQLHSLIHDFFDCNVILLTVLLFSLLYIPANLLAQEKQPLDSQKKDHAKRAEVLLESTEQMIEQMIMAIDNQKETANESSELADNPNPTSYFSSIPNIKPVSGSITSGFGGRVHPVYNSTVFHSGIDISAAEGSDIQATGDGIVAYSGYEKGYGQKIIINHGYGYKTVYAHLSKSLVRQGQKVMRGEIIGLTGNTGVSTGPHLHYEVLKDNTRVNPTAYFFDDTTPEKLITIQKIAPEQSGKNS